MPIDPTNRNSPGLKPEGRGTRNPKSKSRLPSGGSYPVTKKTHEATGFSFGAMSNYRIFRWVEVGNKPENPRFSWLLDHTRRHLRCRPLLRLCFFVYNFRKITHVTAKYYGGRLWPSDIFLTEVIARCLTPLI